jgi:hypothetical protein
MRSTGIDNWFGRINSPSQTAGSGWLLAATLAAACLLGAPQAGAVVVTDDFSDGNDTANPTWHHLNNLVGSTGQSWTVTNGRYRLIDPTTETIGSQFPGLETLGFVGSYVDPQFTDVRLTVDVVEFTPPGFLSSWFGTLIRSNGNNGLPNAETGLQMNGYTYHYEGTADDGNGEMVLGILYPDGLKDIGSQKVTLDPAKDYRVVFEAIGNVLHGQVFELDSNGQVVAMVAEKERDLDANPPDPDNYDFDPNTPDQPFVPYTGGYSGVFGLGSYFQANADFTIDNFRTESVASGLPGDFDGNSVVNSADLEQWKGDFAANADSDADGDGDSDGADFLIWQQNVGAPGAGAAASAVPEPATIGLASVLGALLLARRRRRTD